LNLDKSLNDLYKRIERLDPSDGDDNDTNHLGGKEIIPVNGWIRLKGTPYALE
jgi:hypothetical protein